MSDFIREVDEDYRRDRLFGFFSRFQIPIALLVVMVIAGAAFYRYWSDQQTAQAQKVNDSFMAAADLQKAGKDAEAQAAFASITKDGPAGYALLARMRSAEALAARDPEAAAKALDAVADDETVATSMRDAARLRGALLRIDRDDPKVFEQRYDRVAGPTFSFASSMRELLALAALKRQDMAAAGRYLDDLVLDPGTPGALRGRAQALRNLVNAGPAIDSASQPPPANVTVISGAAPTAPLPSAPTPDTSSSVVPRPPANGAAPPATTAAPSPPAASPAAPVPPSIKPPGNTPPD